MSKHKLSLPIQGWVLGYFVIIVLASSCTVTKQSSYFKTLQNKDTTLTNFITNTYESKILVGDKLSITVSSLSPIDDAIFNAPNSSTSSANTSASAAGYEVQLDGTILLHRLGATQAAGLTRKALSKYIQDKLLAYLKEPIVQVKYVNHKLTVLGQVGSPQVINLPEEQISLIDALVMSGDISENGLRNNITIIRESGNEKQVKHVNLEDHSILSSPWYYVKANDIIFVEADYKKSEKLEQRNRLQGNISLFASIVSLVVIVITQIFIKQ